MSDNSALVDLLSTYESQSDVVVRAKDQATDARSQAESALAELVTAAQKSDVVAVKQSADAIRECEKQIQELVDNPGGVTELKVGVKKAQAGFFAAAEEGDARIALAAWRQADKDLKEKQSEVKDLNKAKLSQTKNLLSAVKTLF